MKKLMIATILFVLMLSIVGCGKTGGGNKADDMVNLEELRENYPEYFEMEDFKGIEVYVWQMAEDSYRCGMMSGTNRVKTDEEISALQLKSLSIEEAKAILAETGIEKDDICVIAIHQTCSSYAYEIDDAYIQRVTKLFQ